MIEWGIGIGFVLVLIGLTIWVLKDKVFSKSPNYVTSKYKIKCWYRSVYAPINMERIDSLVYLLMLEFKKEFPATKFSELEKNMSNLKIGFCNDYDSVLYLPAKTTNRSADLPKGIAYKYIDGKLYYLTNGVQLSNNVFVRRISSDIGKTALAHEMLHYLLECFNIFDGDAKHENVFLWEDGMLGRVLKNF